MTTPYTSQSISGYNSNPPPDDGSQTAANQVKWDHVKTKVGDPVKTLAEGIDTALVTAFGKIFGNAVSDKSTNYNVLTSDQGKVINCTSAITVTLPAAASAAANFVVVVRNGSSGTVTVDGNSSELINGEASVTLTSTDDFIILFCTGSAWIGTIHKKDLFIGAKAYTAADQAVSTASYTRIAFELEIYDTDSIHDTVTNNSRLTVPTGATYGIFTGQVEIESDATGYRALIIEHENTSPVTSVAETAVNAVNGVTTIVNVSTGWIPVTPGEYYRLGVYQNASGSLNVIGTSTIKKTWFSCSFVKT